MGICGRSQHIAASMSLSSEFYLVKTHINDIVATSVEGQQIQLGNAKFEFPDNKGTLVDGICEINEAGMVSYDLYTSRNQGLPTLSTDANAPSVYLSSNPEQKIEEQ